MIKLLLIVLMSSYAMSGFINETEMKATESAQEDKRLCKIFTEKVQSYESNMREDGLAEATLVSYKQRMSAYCDTSSVKANAVKVETVKPVETVKVEIKAPESAKESERLCNVFTDKVKTYESTMRNDSLAEATLVSYKKRMSAFCATTPAKS